ncbi:hypothetical protein E2C01_052260 [Portunus trituberculatus]|uniref:Uncharacterized protein n=1 Tax=Portunus trituberculatus TaxID=210409 RepID=A0A5B7GNX2_PORTR|nr:hypothetical protein [Portunus trituberculatus]
MSDLDEMYVLCFHGLLILKIHVSSCTTTTTTTTTTVLQGARRLIHLAIIRISRLGAGGDWRAHAWCPLKEGLSDWPTLSPAPPSRACPHPPHAHSTPITTHRHNTLLFACGHKARVPAHTRPYVPAPRGASHLTLIQRSVLEGRRLEGEGEMNVVGARDLCYET